MILRVPDIGDGLSAAIYTQPRISIQIDCGSQQSAKEAFIKGMRFTNPNFFVLSHFHSDHYNGLFEGVRAKERFSIQQVIMPIIPRFRERKKFTRCLFAVNARILGGGSGSMDYDFLSIINKLSKPTSYRRVKSGDEVVLDGVHIQILWPPKVLNDDELLVSVQNAITDFNNALDQDDILKGIYNSLPEKGILESYLSDNEMAEMDAFRNDELQLFPTKRDDIPDATKKANASLRGVANRLSLAFRMDSNLLFLGDLESNEINAVVDNLKEEQRLRFPIMITPHHGTHWSKGMEKLSIDVAVSSVGEKLFRNVKPNYKYVVYRHLLTYVEGEVLLTNDLRPNCKCTPWWYFL